MNLKLNLIFLCLLMVSTTKSQTSLYADDFETAQTWTIFEEIVSGNTCYGDNIGEVALSTDFAHGGTNSLRVWSNKNAALKSNHVIAAHHISNTDGVTGRLRYGLWAYTGTTLGLTQASPEFSVQSTRTVGGVNLTYIAGVQYVGNQWVSDKWNVWHNGIWQAVKFSEFGVTLAENTWYYLELEFDMTTNRYIQLKVKGGSVDATLDMTGTFQNAASGFQIGAETRNWTPSYFVTLESENLWTSCAEVRENKTYYDNIRLEAVTTQFATGTTHLGSDSYVEYRAGALPIILSAPHDGTLEPADIPDRSCVDCTTVRDLNTKLLAEAISTAIESQFGCKPHLVFTTLHRKKLDANRDITEAALGNLKAEMAWHDYHNFITAARKNIISTQNRGILIDIHGHGHTVQRVEWGYLLETSDLQKTDTDLSAQAHIDESSLRRLVGDNIATRNLPQLVRGSFAMGSLMASAGYPSVPSAADAAPQTGEDYFSGGFITEKYGSMDNSAFDAIQMEAYNTGIRNTAANRTAFATAFASALQSFMTQHYFATIPCNPVVVSIELLDFKGKVEKEGNRLTWILADKTDVQNIEILKSQNGRDFTPLSILSKNEVDFLDKSSFDLTYYQLKINELEGKPKFSKIISINRKNTEGGKMRLFPNPVSDILTLENAEGKDIQIVNALGQMVLQKTVLLSLEGLVRLNIGHLPTGIYFVKTVGETLRFVKN